MSSRAVSLWLLRIMLPTVAFIVLFVTLFLDSWLTGSDVLSCAVAGQRCWGERVGQAVAYGIGGILFVLLPALLEPDEKFGVAVVFYSLGILVDLFMTAGFYSLSSWESWPMVFPPIITGLGCVFVIGRVWGYGSVGRVLLSSPVGLSKTVRYWWLLRRILLVPLVLGSVFAVVKGAAATEDWIYSLCPPGNYFEGNDSVPESCINPGIERLVILNGYAAVALGMALAVGVAVLLEPRHKSLAARLVWLVGSGFLGILTPLSLLESDDNLLNALIAFAAGALCVGMVGRIYPREPREDIAV